MVYNRTVNPHRFHYGGLHHYVVAAGAVIPVAIYDLFLDPEPPENDALRRNEWKERQRARIFPLARVISAVMAVGVVCLTFIIGTSLFDRGVGYLAALLLTVSMPFVAIAHFATVDSAANFWYWLSCLFALLIWRRGDRIWYILAAVTAGFAIGTKIDRLVILLPLLLSHLLRREGLRVRTLIPIAILLPTSFVLANPALLLAPFEFLDGFTRDLFFNFLRDAGKPSYTRILEHARSGLGMPLFVMVLAGIAYALIDLARRRNATRIVWLLATFAPYYFIIGSRFILPWYIPFFFPPLMILAAHACRDVPADWPHRYVIGARSVVVTIIGYSFLHTAALVMQFSNDSRYQASAWVEQHIPANATIETFKRAMGPTISSERYRVIESLPDRKNTGVALTTRARLHSHLVYQRLRLAILDLEQWTGRHLGLPVRKEPYVTWFDGVAARYETSSDETLGFTGIQSRRPEYVILTEHHQRKRWSAQSSPVSGYRLLAEFKFSNSFGIQPHFSFVNPWVYIFQYEGKAASSPVNITTITTRPQR
jgi:hypothetical protein